MTGLSDHTVCMTLSHDSSNNNNKYTVPHNYRIAGFQRQNLVNMRFVPCIYKTYQARAGDNAVQSAIRISKICTAFTLQYLHQCDVIGWTDQRIDNICSQAVSSLSMLVSKQKADTLNTELSSSLA